MKDRLMMDIDNQNQYFKGGSIMAYDFRDSNGKWTGSSNESGYCSDVYGNYTGRISSASLTGTGIMLDLSIFLQGNFMIVLVMRQGILQQDIRKK